MKKMVCMLLTGLSLYSCRCESEEVGRLLLNDENRAYLNPDKRSVNYYNEKGLVTAARFNGAGSVLHRETKGPEVCTYTTYEDGREHFVFGPYEGELVYSGSLLLVELYKEDERNVLNLFDFVRKYDERLQDVQLSGFLFKDVLVLEKALDGGSVDKLVLSKANGIEFILFEDGSWYKRSE